MKAYVATITGNTPTAIPFIEKCLGSKLDVELNPSESIVVTEDQFIIGTYTYGTGKIPEDLKKFLIENQHNFKGKRVFIFGSGNSIYKYYNRAVDSIKKILEDCGAIVEVTLKFEQRFDEEQFEEEELFTLKGSIKKFGGNY